MPPRRLLLLLLPSLIHAATPGTLLDSDFPVFSSQATVREVALANDGSVFLTGDFVAVDGVYRPGLAKLTANGTLDPSFVPPPLETAPGPWIAFPQAISSPLFALPAGRLMVPGIDSWKLLDAYGHVNVTLLADLPRSGSPIPRPQFQNADRVYMITGDAPALRAYCVSDLLPDPGFVQAAVPRPPFQAVPAAAGKLWVLGRSPAEEPFYFYPPATTYTLYRLEENGVLDTTFQPRPLPADSDYSLQSTADGGFRLTSEWLGAYYFSPSATRRSFTTKRHDSAGVEQGSVNSSVPFSWSSNALVFQQPDLAIYPDFHSTHLLRSQPGTYLPDPAFSVALAAPQIPVTGPLDVQTFVDFPDGKLLVGGTRRLLADGTADPSWRIPRLSKSPAVSELLRLPDGATLVWGNFDLANGTPAPGLVKLRPDDSPDPTFSPAFDFRLATKIRAFPDATLLALFEVPAVDASGRQSQLVRFTSDGKFLNLWPIPEPPGSAILYYGEVTDFAIQSDGTTLVTTFQNNEVPTVGFRRIHPDGSSPLVPGSFLNSTVGGALLVLADDSYLRGNTRFAADGTLIGTLDGIVEANPAVQLPDRSVIFIRPFRESPGPFVQRWHPVTGADFSFVNPFEGVRNIFIAGVSPAANGKMFVRGDLGSASVVRLHATGQLDPTFRPPAGNVNATLAGSGGNVLVAGTFDSLDGQPRSALAHLADTRAVGFNEWIAAATSRTSVAAADRLPSADPDRDGSTNLLEYAAGSDPAMSDPARSQVRNISPLTWMIPCNPEAPEILRRLETTTDLTRWQPARADQVRLETPRASLTWTLLPGSSSLFSRVRIE